MIDILPVVLFTIVDNNDRNFLESIYNDYNKLMYSEIIKITGDVQAAEDIMQESLIKLADKIPLLQSLDKARRINYVITTVRNMAKNHLRAKNGIILCSLDDDDFNISNTISDGSSIEESVILFSDKEKFEQVWQKLDETSKILLEGKYILQKDDAALAEFLGIKPSSIRMMLTRARKKALKLMTET